MGKVLDVLLHRKFKATKFKTTVNLAVSRLTVLKNHRQARLMVARSDTIQFLKLNHHEQALLRVDQVIKEQNMMDVLVMVDGYCHLLLQMIDLIKKERICPDELKEAVSSLLFAAPRCGEFPELQKIRSILTARYGKEFAHDAIELRNNCGVNTRMIQKLSPRLSSLETRMKVLQEIAIENDIVLKLDDSPSVVTEGESGSMNGEIEKNSSALGEDFDEILSYLESVKGKKTYKGVEDAAQAAFESAAYAAAAARAAVELSRSRSFGSDHRNSPNSGSRKILNTRDSKLQKKHEKTQENESESESEPEPEPEQEGERSKNSSDESDNENEMEIETIDSSSSELLKMPQGVQQLDLTKRLISVRSKPVYGR